MNKLRITITFLLLFFTFQLKPQKNIGNCDLKKMAKNIIKVHQKNTIKELDQLFGSKSQVIEVKNDSTYFVYKYQFCDSNVKNTIFVVYFKNKLSQITKNFSVENCYQVDLDHGFAAKKEWTYKEFKKIFGEEGDLMNIFWDVESGKELQRSYTWRSCRSSTSYNVIFKDGKMDKVNQFPNRSDYSRPSNGKKQ